MRSQMTNEQRALQFWSVLVLAARSQQLLSYKSMEKLTGIPKQGVGRVLAPIQAYCKRNKLPPLTALVINEDEGLPGLGFTGATEGNVFAAQSRVFVFDWFAEKVPTPDEFGV